MFYRSPEACSGARCSVAPPANKRQMQDLGALALPWSRRLGRLNVHPCRADPSSPKSHLQSPGCSLFDSRGCSGTYCQGCFSLSPLLQLQLLWVCFCFFFSAPLLVNWDPIWLRTIVTVLLVTVRDPRNNNTLQKGRREETSTKESFERPSRRPFPPHHLNFFLPSQSSILFLFLYHSFAGKSLFSACSNSAIACFIIAGACFSVLPTGTGTDTDIGAAPSLCFSRPQLPTAPSFVFNCRSRNLKLSVQPKSFVSHILSFHFARVFFPLPPTKRHKRPTDAELDRGDKAFDLLLVCLFVRSSGHNLVSPSFFPSSHRSPVLSILAHSHSWGVWASTVSAP